LIRGTLLADGISRCTKKIKKMSPVSAAGASGLSVVFAVSDVFVLQFGSIDPTAPAYEKSSGSTFNARLAFIFAGISLAWRFETVTRVYEGTYRHAIVRNGL
jgi:hypothetical protein